MSRIESLEPTVVSVPTELPSVQLRDLDWKEKHIKGFFVNRTEKWATVPIDYNGAPLDAHVLKRDPYKKPDHAIDSYDIFLRKAGSTSDKDPHIIAKLNFSDVFSGLQQGVYAGTFIERIDPKRELPRGAGLELYKMLLQNIQQEANAIGRPIKHIAQRVALKSPGERPLTQDQWEEIFLPILDEFNIYTKTYDGNYEATYYPKK